MDKKETEKSELFMDTAKIRQLQALDEKKRKLEAEVKQIIQDRAELEKEVLEQFAESGIDKISVDGKIVFLRKEIWASPLEGDRASACKYLKENNLEIYVSETFNSISISAFVREYEKEDGTMDLPEDFTKYFKITDTFKVITRK